MSEEGKITQTLLPDGNVRYTLRFPDGGFEIWNSRNLQTLKTLSAEKVGEQGVDTAMEALRRLHVELYDLAKPLLDGKDESKNQDDPEYTENSIRTGIVYLLEDGDDYNSWEFELLLGEIECLQEGKRWFEENIYEWAKRRKERRAKEAADRKKEVEGGDNMKPDDTTQAKVSHLLLILV